MVNSDQRKKMFSKAVAIVELIIILGIIIFIPGYIYITHPEFIDNFRSIEAFDSFLKRYENQSIAVYLVCQIVQVVVTVIPGQVVQIAGGYMFGLILGTILSLIGVMTGASISFAIARLLGQRPMKLMFGEQRFTKYNNMLNTKKAHRIIFLLYLIPGLPKDMVAYAAGVSRMRYISFLIISTTGRFPAMTVSIVMGTMLNNESYTGAVILSIIVVAICIMCFLKRKSIIDFTDRYYYKMNTKK